MLGTTIGVIKGDTRSLDYISHGILLVFRHVADAKELLLKEVVLLGAAPLPPCRSNHGAAFPRSSIGATLAFPASALCMRQVFVGSTTGNFPSSMCWTLKVSME